MGSRNYWFTNDAATKRSASSAMPDWNYIYPTSTNCSTRRWLWQKLTNVNISYPRKLRNQPESEISILLANYSNFSSWLSILRNYITTWFSDKWLWELHKIHKRIYIPHVEKINVTDWDLKGGVLKVWTRKHIFLNSIFFSLCTLFMMHKYG